MFGPRLVNLFVADGGVDTVEAGDSVPYGRSDLACGVLLFAHDTQTKIVGRFVAE